MLKWDHDVGRQKRVKDMTMILNLYLSSSRGMHIAGRGRSHDGSIVITTTTHVLVLEPTAVKENDPVAVVYERFCLVIFKSKRETRQSNSRLKRESDGCSNRLFIIFAGIEDHSILASSNPEMMIIHGFTTIEHAFGSDQNETTKIAVIHC